MRLDPVRVTASIAATMRSADAKLTEKQEILLAGCLAVWLAKAHDDGAEHQQRKLAEGMYLRDIMK